MPLDDSGDERTFVDAVPELPGVGPTTAACPSIRIAGVPMPLNVRLAPADDSRRDKAEPSALDPDGRPIRPRRDLF